MKKFISLAVALMLIYTMTIAAPLAQSRVIFEQAGFAIGDISPLPEEMDAEQKYIETAKLQYNTDEAQIREAYRLVDNKPTPVAADFSFVLAEKSNRQELISRLSSIINAEGNYENDPFYKGAIAFLMAINDSDAENANNVLKQILAQHEINSYFPDSPMTSYVDNEKGQPEFDENADSKNPVLDGKKYFLKIKDDGFVLSLRVTDEQSTIEIANETVTQAEATNLIVNKQYAWDSLNAVVKAILAEGFEPGADAKAIALPLEKMEDGKVRIVCTGTGVLLTQDKLYKAFRHSDSAKMSITDALKAIVKAFPTLDSYARIAGADGVELIAYLEDGEKIYNKDNITDFADLLTAALGEPVLLGEDESVPAKEESLEEAVDKDEPPTINLNQADDEKKQSPESSEEPNLETTPEPSAEPENDTGKQIEIKKKLVNIRKEPGGKVIFRLKRGKKAEITGESVKKDGYSWYPIKYDDKDGWVRSDTVNVLDYVKPAENNSDENITINNGEYTALGMGNKGENVKKLQERLVELGYLSSEPDGNYGGKTEKAVRNAQNAFNMKATGKADEAFQTMLYSENAISELDARMAGKKPDTMKLNVDELKKAEKSMKARYSKELGGYATGVILNNTQNNYSLAANSVDNSTSNYEISISFNDAQGAAQVDPKFVIKVLNLYIQDIEKVELVRGKNVTELPKELWSYDSGLVTFDITLDQKALNDMMDKRICTEIRFSNASENYVISMDSKSGPYLISKYMLKVWKTLGAQKVAEAAKWQRMQQ